MKFRFLDFSFDTDRHVLMRGDRQLELEPQLFDLLHLLLRHAGALISRDQMLQEVWNGRIVSESAISAQIARLRKVLGDDGKRQQIIRTVPRRGIQFVTPLETDAAPPPASRPPTIRFTQSDDGTSLAWCEAGTGAPVLYLPYFPTHLNLDWQEPTERAFFDFVADGRRLIRYDQRGTGLSSLDRAAQSQRERSDDVLAVADAAGADRFSMIGMNHGTMTAIDIAARHPDRVDRLVLIAAYGEGRLARRHDGGTTPEPIRLMLDEGWETSESAMVAAYVAVYFPEFPRDIIERLARYLQGCAPRANVLEQRDQSNAMSVMHLLDRVDAPVLLIHSRRDQVHPLSQAQQLAAGLRHAQLVVLDTANAWPRPGQDCWAQFTDEIARFLDG